MIPETRTNSTIELFRATRFPYDWELEKVLFTDVAAVDPTVYADENGVWLFVNMSCNGGSTHDELFLFYADSPVGDWIPHRQNPIVSDVASARPAGRLFRQDGALIRPSQDNSVRYGFAINFNRVDALTKEEYRETLLDRITPDIFAGGRATHTYSVDGALEMIDGMRLIPRWTRNPLAGN